MLNSLDFLVIVFMAMAVVSLLAVSLMFLVRNVRIKKISLYIAAALSLYICAVSVRMFLGAFPLQLALGLILGGMSVASLVFSRSVEKFKLARILASVSLVLGMVNLFM